MDLNGSGSAAFKDEGSTEPEQNHHQITTNNQTGNFFKIKTENVLWISIVAVAIVFTVVVAVVVYNRKLKTNSEMELLISIYKQ